MSHLDPPIRVAITGLGLVCPLGSSPEALWDALATGRSGVDRLSSLPPEHLTANRAQALYKLMIIYYTENHHFNSESFVAEALAGQPELASHAEILALKYGDAFKDIDEEALGQEIQNSLNSLKKNYNAPGLSRNT